MSRTYKISSGEFRGDDPELKAKIIFDFIKYLYANNISLDCTDTKSLATDLIKLLESSDQGIRNAAARMLEYLLYGGGY